MKIAIIGAGYVGRAMRDFFARRYSVEMHDVDSSRETDADVGVICVPTPSSVEGRFDLAAVKDAVGWCPCPLILLKSTVTPGTTDGIRARTGKAIVYCPEFIGESSYWSPYAWDRVMVESPFFVFGGRRLDTSRAVDLYTMIAGPCKRYVQTDAPSAEMMKLVTNAFAATKITFCYEIAQLCKMADLDYNAVRELWLHDPRVGSSHTAVFADNVAPFGGKCLPKDLAALIAYGLDAGGGMPSLLQAVLDANARIGKERKTLQDEVLRKARP